MMPSQVVSTSEEVVEKSACELQQLYGQLQSFLAWTNEDAVTVATLGPLVEPHFEEMVEDFYSEILRHEPTRQVLRSPDQVQRLKTTLRDWLQQLFTGPYDLEYIKSRWRVGRRHVEIGLDQTYATAALGRLRWRISECLQQVLTGETQRWLEATTAVNKLMDMESAVINSAYQLSFARMMERSAQQQMQQSERLAAIGQMVTGLAHESRNALQRSHACLEMLELDLEDRPEARQMVQRVQSALDHLHTLYEQVRNYAAPIKLDRQSLSLPKLITRCWQQLEHKWQPNSARLQFESPADCQCDLRLDPNRMEQVMINLFQNAIDAAGQDGRVTCQIQWLKPGTVLLEVSDNGPGVRLSPPQKIFEPFFTTKTKGTGLGLAITRRIIQAHGGEIEVLPGQGATFRIVLPCELPELNERIGA